MSRLRTFASRLVSFLALAAAMAGALASPGRDAAAARKDAGTDAFSVSPPPSPWRRAEPLDPAGRLTWGWIAKDGTTGLLRVSVESPRPPLGQPRTRWTTPPVRGALDAFLAIEEIRIRDELEVKLEYRMSAVERDSFAAGATMWRGFRARLEGPELRGDVYRYAALDPSYPAPMRLFLIAYEEIVPRAARGSSRFAEVRQLAGSVVPRGRGVAGPLETAYVDARAATFAARIDSSARLCWSTRAGATAGQARLGLGRGLVPGADFFQFSESVPADSLVDAGTSEYGAAFDRNGDGRYDLLVVNQGVRPVRAGGMEALVTVAADDDFDGRVDACVLEDGDLDGDRRVDHRLAARDTNRDGIPDRAWAFVDRLSDDDGDSPRLENGRLRVRRAGGEPDADLASSWREWSAVLRELDAARQHCP